MKYIKVILVFTLAFFILGLIDVLFGGGIDYTKNLSLIAIGLVGYFIQSYVGKKSK